MESRKGDAINYLRKNVDFYLAPAIDMALFNRWLERHPEYKEKILSVTKDINTTVGPSNIPILIDALLHLKAGSAEEIRMIAEGKKPPITEEKGKQLIGLLQDQAADTDLQGIIVAWHRDFAPTPKTKEPPKAPKATPTIDPDEDVLIDDPSPLTPPTAKAPAPTAPSPTPMGSPTPPTGGTPATAPPRPAASPPPAATPSPAVTPPTGAPPPSPVSPASPAAAPPGPAPSPAGPAAPPVIPPPAAAAPPVVASKPLPDFTKSSEREKHRPLLQNVKKRFDEYRKLINHYRSIANVAVDRMDDQAFKEIQAKCKELEDQLRIYEAYTKYKLDQAQKAEASKNIFDKIRYDDSDLIQSRLDKVKAFIVKLEEVAKITPTTAASAKKQIHSFSDDSKVVDLKDVDKQVKDYLGVAAGALPSAGGLMASSGQKTTDAFAGQARVNLQEHGNARFVSVQFTENNEYKSNFYAKNLDLSMQGSLLGHRIPNDALLAIAIKEIQNWRAGNPKLESSTMKIRGNMPEALVEALVLYCEHRGYRYSNTTPYQLKPSSIQVEHYRERLRKHPDMFIDDIENRGLLDKGRDVAEAQKHTRRNP